jgi:hypothetical protein
VLGTLDIVRQGADVMPKGAAKMLNSVLDAERGPNSKLVLQVEDFQL